MAMALGVTHLDEIAERIQSLLHMKAPEGFLDKLKMLPQVAELTRAFPKTISAKDAACKQVVIEDNGRDNLLNLAFSTSPVAHLLAS